MNVEWRRRAGDYGALASGAGVEARHDEQQEELRRLKKIAEAERLRKLDQS